MSMTPRCWLGWAALLALGAAVLAADGPMPPADAPKSAPPVIILGEEGKGPFRFLPRLYVLTPEEYERLRADSERLKTQARPVKPVTPSSCEVTGSVENDLARLRAEFKFETKLPRTAVLLACAQGQPASASLDGKLPLLQLTEEGFVVVVESAGVHALQLELEVPVAARGDRPGERGFTLDLPHASITNLQLDLPEGVKDIRLGSDGKTRRTVGLKPVPGSKQARLERRSLGVTDRVEVSWHGRPAAPEGPPLLAAAGVVLVRLSDRSVLTEADLTLKPLRGEVDRWRLQVPPGATVEVRPPEGRPEEPPAAVVEAHDPKSPFRTVRLPAPSAEP
ncbi:MAG TPA: hypothetical protein VFA26_22975, partial [Gemmataceae bacterium]|nr:hypothetical protein [Gemmataceae bacterium]